MPDVDTILINSMPVRKCRWFDNIIPREEIDRSEACMPPLWMLPEGYDSAIYTDCDTFWCMPVYDVFEMVEGPKFDIALVHTSGKKYDWEYPKEPDVPEAFPHYGSAFVPFKDTPEMRKFFDDWRDLYYEHKAKHSRPDWPIWPDQGSLRIALWRSNLRVLTLERHYSTKPGGVIVSRHVRHITTPKAADPAKWGRVVNKHAPLPRLLNEGKSMILGASTTL